MLPVLKTNRLLLEPRSERDLEDCIAMDSDIEVRRYITADFRDNFDVERYRAELLARIGRDFGPGLGYWVLRPAADRQGFLGLVLLLPLEDGGEDIEIGWRLPRSNWGRGYASEAALALLGHAFGALSLAEVKALINPDNTGSLGVARKLGFQPDGRRATDGECYDQYRLTCDEFRAPPPQA